MYNVYCMVCDIHADQTQIIKKEYFSKLTLYLIICILSHLIYKNVVIENLNNS